MSSRAQAAAAAPSESGFEQGTIFGGAKPIPLLVSLALGAAIWFSPTPEGLKPEAWHLFAIFVATITAIIGKALPMGAIAIGGIAVVAVTGVLDPTSSKKAASAALSGFSHRLIWLIVAAFFVARGFIKTGLGERIAYYFVRVLGKRTLGLSYGLALADLVISPAVPSSTARGGGIIFPIAKSVAVGYGSHPDGKTNRKMGGFLMFTAYQVNLITGGMFLTAGAANPLMLGLAADLGVTITWGSWFLAACVPGAIAMLAIPYFNYKMYPPEVKETPNAVEFANNKLMEMGKMKIHEWIMFFTFVTLLILWIFSKDIGVYTTSSALLGLFALLVFGVLDWDDVKNEKGAWNTLVWFAALVMMATYLKKLGFIKWFSALVGANFVGVDWMIAWPLLIIIYTYIHYTFASITAQVAAMYSAFLAIGIGLGVPPMLMAMSLAFASHYFASMTHYGAGPAPVFFGAGYVELSDWWKYGFMVSVLNIVIWMGIGGAWWKVIGLW